LKRKAEKSQSNAHNTIVKIEMIKNSRFSRCTLDQNMSYRERKNMVRFFSIARPHSSAVIISEAENTGRSSETRRIKLNESAVNGSDHH